MLNTRILTAGLVAILVAGAVAPSFAKEATVKQSNWTKIKEIFR